MSKSIRVRQIVSVLNLRQFNNPPDRLWHSQRDYQTVLTKGLDNQPMKTRVMHLVTNACRSLPLDNISRTGSNSASDIYKCFTSFASPFVSGRVESLSSPGLGFTRRAFYSTINRIPIIQSPLLASIVSLCRSCGVPLQSLDPLLLGFYSESLLPKKKARPEDLAFEQALNGLEPSDITLLTNSLNKSLVDAASYKISKGLERQVLRGGTFESKRLETLVLLQQECMRCHDALYKSSYSASQFSQWLIDQVLDLIPSGLTIVLVASTLDFPLGLSPRIFNRKLTASSNIIVVINKADLWFERVSLCQKYGETFCKDYIDSKFGIDRANSHIVSAKLGWNMDKLFQAIPSDLYVIGSVNSGKLTILNAFMLKCFQAESRTHLNKKEIREQQKLQDRMGLPDVNNKMIHGAKHTIRRQKETVKRIFCTKVGPGSLYFPGFTRGHIPVELESRVVYDVPGFAAFDSMDENPQGIYSYVSHPRVLKHACAGLGVYKSGRYDSKYHTIKPGQCLMLGGLVYVQFPEDAASTLYQIRNCINLAMHVFSSFQKAVKVSTQIKQIPAMSNKFLVSHTANLLSNWTRHIIPPFYGSIDLVIHQLGHFNIKPMGSYPLDAQALPIAVYLPPGVQAIVRLPITNYIAKSFSGRDNNGNPLRKENIPQLSTFALNRYANKTPFYSQLVSTSNQELLDALKETGPGHDRLWYTSRDLEQLNQWVSKFQGRKVSASDLTFTSDKSMSKFWIEHAW